jgi:predicted TPR repeat methyltransferase
MASAVACAGSVTAEAYVVALEDGEFEELDPWEESLFQKLMYENPERLERLIRCFNRMHLILT